MNTPLVDVSRNNFSVSDSSFTVRVKDIKMGWHSRPAHDLVMIRGVRGYSWLLWKDGSKQIMAYTIKHYIDLLPEYDFIRVHQNCVINRHFVQKVQLTHRGPLLRLITGDEIAISRRRWAMVKRELQHLCGGNG